MSATNRCPECGAGLPADAPRGLCPRCLIRAATSATETYAPEPPPSAPIRPASAAAAVDLHGFLSAARTLGLIAADDLKRLAEGASGDAVRLARTLVQAGKLTPYQAGALLQGKARGLLIGHYLVLEKLGVGGMGVVFKARHRPSGRVVALKMLPPSFGRDRDAVRRFRREFEVASRLSHPNLVAAIEASEDRGVHFLTMDYIEGYDLERLVTNGGPLALKLALHCAIQAARGLEAAHAQGIIHRDIKPGNVMIDSAGSVRVLDLGLARVIEATNGFGRSVNGSLTQTGTLMGTIDFLAPEQADNAKRADHRADIYSLGCTLHFLLTGEPPFGGDTVLKRLMAHQERPAPALRDARPEVSETLEATYQAMMAKRPDDRPQSISEVVLALEACRSSAREAGDASADLKTFARVTMSRPSPRDRRGAETASFVPAAEPIDLATEDPPPVQASPETAAPARRTWRRALIPIAGVTVLLALAVVAVLRIPRPAQETPAKPPSARETPVALPPPTATSESPLATLFADDFKTTKDHWYYSSEEELANKVVDAHGYRDGIWYAQSREPGWYAWIVPCEPTPAFEADIRARVVVDPATSRGSLAIHLFAEEPRRKAENKARAMQVRLDNEARLYVEPSFWTVEAFPDGPWTGPITHPAIRPGGEWNELRLRVRDRRLEIAVNSVPVCDIADFDWDLLPMGFNVGVVSEEGLVRAEFDRFVLRALGDTPAAPAPPRLGRLIYADDFSDPASGWRRGPIDMGEGNVPNRLDYERGLYFIEANENWYGAQPWDCTDLLPEPYQVRLVGRVLGTGDAEGTWGAFVITADGRGLSVRIDRHGAVSVEPAFQGLEKYPGDRRYLGPIQHGAMRPAEQWNTLTLRVQKRRLEVLVNNETVGKPIDLDWDLLPSKPQISVYKPNFGTRIRGEYEHVEVRALAVTPP